MSSAPAILLAIPLLAGVVAGALAGGGAHLALVVLAIAWSIAGIALWRTPVMADMPSAWRAVHVLAIVVGSGAAGVAIGSDAAERMASPTILTWFHESASRDDPVPLTGVLRDDATGMTVTIDVLDVDRQKVAGAVRATVTGSLALGGQTEWRAGRTVAINVLLREPIDYRDPGVPSDRARLARQGIALLGSVKSAALTSIVSRGTILSESAGALRAWVRTATNLAVGRWSARSAGVVTAILIGDRGGLDADDQRRLQEAGTYHVIAISGGNIALLTALLVTLGRTARLPGRATAAGSIALLAFYGYAAGLAPSVLRATLAGMVYLAARAVDHRGTALNALAVAAAFAATTAPLTVLDAGFVLSFGATAAIVVAASRMAPMTPHDRDASALRTRAMAILNAARVLGAATICAEIALAPVGARLFGRVSFAGLLLNFAAIPLMSVIQIAGLAAVAFGMVSTAAASLCGWVAHVATVALLRSASLVDVAPWLVWDLPPPAMWVIALWYAGWGGLLAAPGRRMRRLATAAIAVSAVLIVHAPPIAGAMPVPAAPTGWTRIVILDVGQGDATLVFPPGARPLVVDAGGAPGTTFDLGRRVTLPAAWAFGARSIDALVLTHGDPDHIGGAPAIMRALAPREIWDGIPVPRHDPLRRLHEAAARAGIEWVEKRAGESIHAGPLRIDVLNPPEPDWERRKVRNDDSIVLEVRVGDVAVVLPGDITRAAEPAVVARFVPAPLVIVKAPHHGSAGSSSPGFVEALHPAAVVFSAGTRNPFGHPAPAVVDRYRAAGAKVFSTADDGAVVIDTNGHEVVMWTWMGRREALGNARANGQTLRSQRHEGTKD